MSSGGTKKCGKYFAAKVRGRICCAKFLADKLRERISARNSLPQNRSDEFVAPNSLPQNRADEFLRKIPCRKTARTNFCAKFLADKPRGRICCAKFLAAEVRGRICCAKFLVRTRRDAKTVVDTNPASFAKQNSVSRAQALRHKYAKTAVDGFLSPEDNAFLLRLHRKSKTCLQLFFVVGFNSPCH
ncbi:MAG: hypothetical protein HDR33_05445 [Treponema sp.]|nr:hypothetical protein [Treponema sp.]